MADPYAEFGGQAVQKPAADPYAEFGGNAVQQSVQQTPTGTISNAPTGAKAWLNNLEGDIRYGTGQTLPGRLLKKMGAPGVDATQGAGVADQMASIPLGAVKTAQGIADIPQHPLSGILKAGSGALQAASLPLAFTGGPMAGKVISKIPDAKFAGQALNDVKEAIGHLPVDTSKAGDAALRIKDIADSGATMPKVVSNFIRRVTDPAKGNLTFAEAREFYSNASAKLSLEEAGKLTSKMKFQLSQFARALNGSIHDAATAAGQGEKYAAAMREYRQAGQVSKTAENAVKYVVKPAIGAAAGTVGVKAGYDIYQNLKR